MTSAPPCPCCASTEGRPFYACSGIPVQSCVLLDDRAAALAYPHGDLQLLVCAACGFIWNREFSYAVQGEIDAYESSQAFSGRFVEYTTSLCTALGERHDLAGRRVLEIGCGNGDFLRQLVEITGCEGLGLDPAAAEEVDEPGLRIVRDRFEDVGNTPCDLIVCRHTLEHVAEPLSMLDAVRRRSLAAGGCPIVFEVPDTLRILREAAFWDVYYEHCSYFTAGSLARLFRRAGHRIDRLERVYGDQYLVLTATPDDAPPDATDPAEDDLPAILEGVDSFSRRVTEELRAWRERLARAREQDERVVVWGSGSKAAGFLATLGVSDLVPCIVDINPRKQGRFQARTGQEIVSPSALTEYRPDLVVIMNSIYLDEIRADLAKMGLDPEIRAL